MKNRFYVIKGGLSGEDPQGSIGSKKTARVEPNFNVLNRSPCLECELFARGRICPVSEECSKIEAFQRVAAAFRSLYRPADIRSMG